MWSKTKTKRILCALFFFFPRFEQVTCNCYEDSSRRFLLLWLVGVITLVLVSQESLDKRTQTSSLAFNARCWSFAISKASFECSLSPWIIFKCCCKSYELKEKDNWTIENLKLLSMLFDWTFHTRNTTIRTDEIAMGGIVRITFLWKHILSLRCGVPVTTRSCDHATAQEPCVKSLSSPIDHF